MSDENSLKALPEDISFRIGFLSLVFLIAVMVLNFLIGLFLINEAIQFNSIAVSLLISMIFTMILPSVIVRAVAPSIRELLGEIRRVDAILERGQGDGIFILISSFGSILGLALYIYFPTLLEAPDTHVWAALTSNEYSIFQIINLIYIDLFTVGSIGVFLGFLSAAYHRFIYPRRCPNCGNSDCIDKEYCPECASELTDIPSRIDLIRRLL